MVPRVLIVDDEPLARERLAGLVRAVEPAAEIREAANGDDAVDAIAAWAPSVVFLDVQMPGRDGFGVVDAVGTDRMPPVVFVTAYDQHAIRAFDVSALDYLLKPFDEARFRAAWKRATRAHTLRTLAVESGRLARLLTHLDGPPPGTAAAPPPDAGAAGAPVRRWADRVVVRKNQRTILVRLADVQWIESSGNYVALHARRETHEVRETLTSLESRLDPSQFVRIHRRVIVAVDAMKELQPWFGGDQVMILKDGTQLRVSRSYRERVAKRLAGMA
ncbi:MAG TPA: LytTR family DNA-binding domain-containing protein [Gemmatimonadaceae bacterium]|nr:LytTR family DNA-binding domain-containing protein [Gemmatimonadaceae bacterium]